MAAGGGGVLGKWGANLVGGLDEAAHATLHVGRAAAVHPVPVGLAGEGVVAPARRSQRHRVDVPGEADGRLLLVAADLRDEAGAAFGELVIGHAKARALEKAAQVARAGTLHSGRIDGVEREELAGEGAWIQALAHGQCARRCSASWYFSDVRFATSGGIGGAGGLRSKPMESSQLRTYCLSKLSGLAPSFHVASGQKRDESGVSASSMRVRLPRASTPNSNLVSAMMMPRVSA